MPTLLKTTITLESINKSKYLKKTKKFTHKRSTFDSISEPFYTHNKLPDDPSTHTHHTHTHHTLYKNQHKKWIMMMRIYDFTVIAGVDTA